MAIAPRPIIVPFLQGGKSSKPSRKQLNDSYTSEVERRSSTSTDAGTNTAPRRGKGDRPVHKFLGINNSAVDSYNEALNMLDTGGRKPPPRGRK